MQHSLTPAERKEPRYEFTRVTESQLYFDSNRFKSREYNSSFQFAHFTATFGDRGVLTISADDFRQDLRNKNPITHALWIHSLNQLITVSVTGLKVWIYENARFTCKLKIANNSYHMPHLSDVQISDDHQLVVAHVGNSSFFIFFHLLNKKAMTQTVGKNHRNKLLAVCSSSQIALCYAESINEVIMFDVNFDKETCEVGKIFLLPIDHEKYPKYHRCIAEYHFLSENDIIYAFGRPIAMSCIGRIFDKTNVRIYHRDTNTFTELYHDRNQFVNLDLSTDKTRVLLYSNRQFQLINLDKKEKLVNELAEALPRLSISLIKMIDSYAYSNVDHKLPDARTLTLLPFKLQIQFQVCLLNLISQDDTLVKLYYLMADHPRKSLAECVAIAVKHCTFAPSKRWWHYSGLFSQIRKISAAESRESKELILMTPHGSL